MHKMTMIFEKTMLNKSEFDSTPYCTANKSGIHKRDPMAEK